MKKKIIFLLITVSMFIFSNEMIKPQALKYGDTIGIIAPANYSGDSGNIMVKDLEARGFKVVLGDSFYAKWYNYRLKYIICDNEIIGIFCYFNSWVAFCTAQEVSLYKGSHGCIA